MTHGCLIIRAKGERRRMLLHTYHAGMNIPLAVERALPFRARDRFSYLAEWYFRRRYTTRERLLDTMDASAFDDGAGYPPSAAAWIIAASPGLLEPLPWSWSKDLADWSGLDHPYRLTISEEEWLLRDEGGEAIAAINVRSAMLEAIWQMVRRSRKPELKAQIWRRRADNRRIDGDKLARRLVRIGLRKELEATRAELLGIDLGGVLKTAASSYVRER